MDAGSPSNSSNTALVGLAVALGVVVAAVGVVGGTFARRRTPTSQSATGASMEWDPNPNPQPLFLAPA